jgi:hypothetical protein
MLKEHRSKRNSMQMEMRTHSVGTGLAVAAVSAMHCSARLDSRSNTICTCTAQRSEPGMASYRAKQQHVTRQSPNEGPAVLQAPPSNRAASSLRRTLAASTLWLWLLLLCCKLLATHVLLVNPQVLEFNLGLEAVMRSRESFLPDQILHAASGCCTLTNYGFNFPVVLAIFGVDRARSRLESWTSSGILLVGQQVHQ